MNIYLWVYFSILSVIICYSIASLTYIGFYFDDPNHLIDYKYIKIISIFMIIFYCLYVFMTIPFFIYSIFMPILNISLIPFNFIYIVTLIPLIIAGILSSTTALKQNDKNLMIILVYFFLTVITFIHIPIMLNYRQLVENINLGITKRITNIKGASSTKKKSRHKKFIRLSVS